MIVISSNKPAIKSAETGEKTGARLRQAPAARPNASGGGGPPNAPGRQRRKPAGKNDQRHTQASRERGGRPRPGTEPAKTGGGRRRGRQTGRARHGGKHHEPGTGAAGGHRAHQGHRPGGERRAPGTERTRRKNQRARRGGTHEEIRAGRAPDRHRPASGQNSGHHARHEGPKGHRQAAATGKPDHGGSGKQRHDYAPADSDRPHRAANTAAKRRDAPPRRTGTGGGATGTDTHQDGAHPAAAGMARTAQKETKPPERAKRPPQDAENREAAANEENRTTATKPENEREEGRKETPRAAPAQGANANRAEHTTAEGNGAKEKREKATAHPHKNEPATEGSHPPPAAGSGGSARRERATGTGGNPTPPPQRQGRRGRTRDGPKRGRGQGREAGSEATEPLRPA